MSQPAPDLVPPASDPVHTVATAAVYSHCHKVTVIRALERKQLVGYQRVANGRWRIYQSDLDAWIKGEAPRPRQSA